MLQWRCGVHKDERGSVGEPEKHLITPGSDADSGSALMNSGTRFGLFLTLVGFLLAGSAVVYAANANPQSLQQSADVSRNAATVQGCGWIIAGLGLVLTLYGLAANLEGLETQTERIARQEMHARRAEGGGSSQGVDQPERGRAPAWFSKEALEALERAKSRR